MTGTRRLTALLLTIGFLTAATPAQAAPQWWDGSIGKSTITNCASIIQGAPYSEEGAWSWGGFWADSANWPDAGQVIYTHLVVGAVGNACSGQRTWPEISIPSGVQLAISSQNPVYCWAIDFTNNTSSREFAACPQQGYQPSYGGSYAFPALTESQNAYTWPLPQGKGWEFWVPVVSSRALVGQSANPCDCLFGFAKIFDGNSSPVLQSNAGMVADAAAGGGGGGGGAPGDTTGTTPTPTPTPSTGTGQNSSQQNLPAPTPSPPPPVFSSFSAPASYAIARLLGRGLSVSVLIGRAGSRVDAVLSGSPRGRSVSARRVVLARATKANVTAGKATLKLRATQAGKRALRRVRRGTARLQVTVTPPGGAKSTKRKLLRLRR